MARDDEDFLAPQKPPPSRHVLGEPLDALSVHELNERIDVLRAEIVRLEAARDRKSASRAAADSFFKK